MLAAGCGSPAVHSSSSFFTATALWALAGAQTPVETTYGQSLLLRASRDFSFKVSEFERTVCVSHTMKWENTVSWFTCTLRSHEGERTMVSLE